MSALKSQNREWGFFGTAQRNYNFSDEAMDRLFTMTGTILRSELKLPETQIRCFLDSKFGRHFADELSFHGAKEGITEAQFLGVVRKYIRTADQRKNWVINGIRGQEIY